MIELCRLTFTFTYILPVLFTTTFKNKLPPLPLSPLKSTADIRYSHFQVPPDSLSFRFSTYLAFLSSCEPANLTLFLRPHSLPLVAPDPVAPLGVIILPDVYSLNVEINEDRPTASNFHMDIGSLYTATYSRKGLTVSVDVERYCPVAGMWFVGVFFLDGANKPKCSSWMFSEVSTDVLTSMDTIILSPSAISHAAKHSSRRLSDVQQLSSSTRESFPGSHSLQLSVPSNHSFFRRKRFFHASIDVGVHTFPSNVSVVSSEHSSSTSSVNESVSTKLGYSWLSVSLKPSEGRLFRILVLPDMTSMDFLIDECILSPSSLRPSQNIHTFQRNTDTNHFVETTFCPVLVDAGRGVLPKASVSDIRESRAALNVNKSSTLSNGNLVGMRARKSYRFDGLHGSSTVHYFYLRNVDSNRTLQLQMTFSPAFSCPFASQSESASSSEYHSQHKNKQFSQLSSSDEPTAAQGASDNETVFPDSLTFAISLLPWLNPSWPNLIPIRAGSLAVNRSLSEVFVDPSEPFNHVFDRCFTLSNPSRVSRTQAFTYHFTYQPELSQYSNAIRISPWNVMIIPIHLDSKLDTGGSLEISLQLNAFHLTLWVNETHSKPLPRQVILHACFARHRSTSPRDFVHPERCPAWLRLATDRGVYVSVAQAVFTAVSEELLRSQPPHRSEIPPSFDISFNMTMDRSFFYLPYPPPGQWYLSLYAECYSTMKVLCSQHPASTVDVAYVIRSAPCLHHRCRAFGEGASLPPSRVLDPSHAQLRLLGDTGSNTTPIKRWRPPWWNISLYDGAPDITPSTGGYADVEEEMVHPYEGLCVELIAQSLYTSTCACPPGRFGMGCMRPNEPVATKYFRWVSSEPDEMLFARHSYSRAALFLSLSNLAFLPSIGIALVRRLWIPAVAYTYTLVFSALYHLCDTDVMNIPVRMGAQTIGGDAMSFGGYALSKNRGYRIIGVERIAYHSAPRGFRFTSPACPLPIDVLSFCDFFGGFFSLWVTFVAACALPVQYAQLAYVLFVLVLTITLQVARHSAEQFLVPCAFGLVMLTLSWIVRSRQTGRLFPPVQWWILSLFPGLLFALSGVVLFVSPMMKRDYTLLHSLWHILLGCSLLGMLPWPDRWRIALSPVVPRYLPLSCGGTMRPQLNEKQTTHISSRAEPVNNFEGYCGAFDDGCNLPPAHSDSVDSNVHPTRPFYIVRKFCNLLTPAITRFHRTFLYRWWNYKLLCSKWDSILELNVLLDPLVRRWPKLQWLLPHGYTHAPTRHDTEHGVPDVSNVVRTQDGLQFGGQIGVLHSTIDTLPYLNRNESTCQTIVEGGSV